MANHVSSLLVLMSVAGSAALSAQADVSALSADVAHSMAQRGELVLIDVRTPSEWAMTGMPRDSVGANVQDIDFLAQARGAVLGDLDYPVAVICQSGTRSMSAAEKLEAAGFAKVYNIDEGIAGHDGSNDGWIKRGLPTDQFLSPDL